MIVKLVFFVVVLVIFHTVKYFFLEIFTKM